MKTGPLTEFEILELQDLIVIVSNLYNEMPHLIPREYDWFYERIKFLWNRQVGDAYMVRF